MWWHVFYNHASSKCVRSSRAKRGNLKLAWRRNSGWFEGAWPDSCAIGLLESGRPASLIGLDECWDFCVTWRKSFHFSFSLHANMMKLFWQAGWIIIAMRASATTGTVRSPVAVSRIVWSNYRELNLLWKQTACFLKKFISVVIFIFPSSG